MSDHSPDDPQDRDDQNTAGKPDDADTDQTAGTKDDSGKSPHVVIVGPDGMAIEGPPPGDSDDDDEAGAGSSVTELVEQPAKVMRIGSMIKQLLDEVKAAPLDEASRQRLREIHHSSIAELEKGLAPELVEELDRLSFPFQQDEVPSEAELRVAQAQLVGWLEGLFHGIQTALFAQQMAARAQLEQMRRSLPPGVLPPDGQMGQPGQSDSDQSGGGMYL